VVLIMTETTWKSAITHTAPNEIRLRGYRIDDLMGRIDFGQALFLLLRGELPDEKVGRLMTAILVSSIDHGPTPPSVLAARNAASTGASLNACVAAGVLAINRYHGGAIEDCARALIEIVNRADEKSCSITEATEAVLAEYKQRKVRVAGFGHRLHTADPRTPRLFALAQEAGVAGRYVEACQAVEAGLEKQTGKKLPINVDGAIGAVLCELGFEPDVMNGFFILARVAGLIAQSREEMTRERLMRKIDLSAWEYDGPPPRGLE
jgi:citrate synthase